jgi:hypothetical protein
MADAQGVGAPLAVATIRRVTESWGSVAPNGLVRALALFCRVAHPQDSVTLQLYEHNGRRHLPTLDAVRKLSRTNIGRCQGSCRINGFLYAAFVMLMFGSFFGSSVVSI